MAQKGNRRKTPDAKAETKAEILTPEKSDGRTSHLGEDDTGSTPPPIIDVKAGRFGAGLVGLGAGLFAGALAGGLVFVSLHLLDPAGGKRETANRFEGLDARIVSLERQEERVAAALALIVESEARLSGLEDGVDALSDDLGDGTLSRLDQAERAVAGLTDRLADLESAYAGLTTVARSGDVGQSLPLSLMRPALVSNLSQAVFAGRPFALELAAVSRQFPDAAQALSGALGAYAKTGLPPRHKIRQDFLITVPQVMADLRRQEADGPWARLLADLSGILRIRRLDAASGTDARSILLQIESLMKTDPPNALPQALDLLEKLPEDIQAGLAEGSAVLAAHVAADRLLNELSAQISTISQTDTLADGRKGTTP